MIIRSAYQQDCPALGKLAQETYVQTFGHTMSEDELAKALEDRSEAYFKSVLNKNVILIAEDNNQLLGLIQFGDVTYDSIPATDTNIELKKIHVDSSQQGKGIGKQLMDSMLNHERLNMVRDIYLDVFTENEKAIGLYTKYGFDVIGRTPFEVDGKVLGYDLLMKRSND